MGRASSGGSCPLCREYASFTARGTLYRHKGDVRVVIGRGFRECRASGATLEVARRLRANKDAGRHPHSNEDGTWLYVCGRCTPKDRAHCVRPPLQLPAGEGP